MNVIYEDDKVRCAVGDSTKSAQWAIRFKNKHYVVTRAHKKKKQGTCPTTLRGGMCNEWTAWQQEDGIPGGTYDVPILDLLEIESHDEAPPRGCTLEGEAFRPL